MGKQQALERQKEAMKFEASRKAELKRKTGEAQPAEKRKTAKEKGHLNDHTRLYIHQAKGWLYEVESAKRELSLLLQPLKETVLIPRQTMSCTDTDRPTAQPSLSPLRHSRSLVLIRQGMPSLQLTRRRNSYLQSLIRL